MFAINVHEFLTSAKQAALTVARRDRGGRIAALLVAAVALAATAAHAGDPVTVGVTVTGADGRPVQGAQVSVTQVGYVSPSPNVSPHSNTGTTGKNGTVSFNQGASLGINANGPLPAGIYEIHVTHDGKVSQTYVYIAPGQTGANTIDLTNASSGLNPEDNPFGAADRAEAAARHHDRGAYDDAVRDLDDGIDYLERVEADFDAALRDFKRDTGIPPSVDTVEEIDKLLRKIKSIEKVDATAVNPGAKANLKYFKAMLLSRALAGGFLDYLKKQRREMPPFPNQRSAETDGNSQGSIDGLPWLEDDERTRHVGLDRASENVASNVAANHGKLMPRINNIPVHTYHFDYKY